MKGSSVKCFVSVMESAFLAKSWVKLEIKPALGPAAGFNSSITLECSYI